MQQRQIKFRAVTREGYIIREIGQLDFFEDGTYHINEEYPVAILEQSTNLKDKNGVEIYEGDIVRLVHRECEGGGWYSDSNEQGVVYFDSNWGVKFDCRDHSQRVAPWTMDKCEKHWSDHSMPRDYRNIEVVGNIHENADLLK